MPLYPNTLAPPVIPLLPRTQSNPLTLFDAATTAWVAAVITNGGTVSTARKTLVDQLIKGLRTDGVFTKLDRLWLLAGENTASALTDIIGDSLATANSSPTFTTDRGYTFDGSSNFIDTGFNPNSAGGVYVLNSAHIGCYARSINASATHGDQMGAVITGGTPGVEIIFNNGSSHISCSVNSGFNDMTGPANQAAGHMIVTRTGSGATAVYYDGSSLTTGTTSSTSIPSLNIYVGGRNVSAALSNPDGCQVAAAHIGSGLGSTDASNVSLRINTYLTAIGANVY